MDFALNSLRKLNFNNPCDIIREVKTIAIEVEVENFDKFVTSILVKYAEEFVIPELEVMLEHNLVKHILPHDSLTGTGCLPCKLLPRRR